MIGERKIDVESSMSSYLLTWTFPSHVTQTPGMKIGSRDGEKDVYRRVEERLIRDRTFSLWLAW
jgi:hypothetical protein